jgi:hypothetical protein
MNRVINSNCKPTRLLSLISNTNPQVLCLWKLEPVADFQMPYVVQLVTKSISPLRGGTCFKIIPLPVQIFIVPAPVTTVVSQPMEGSERSNKKHDELVNPSFTTLDSRLESLEFISTSVPFNPTLNRYRSGSYFDIQYLACLGGIYNTHSDL